MRVGPSEATAKTFKANQAMAERVVDLAGYLDPSDQALVRGVYEWGMSTAELARAAGAHPRCFSRRLGRLVKRITSPAFTRVVGQLRHWPEPRRKVAEAVFLRGWSQREAARRLGVTVHRIRRESDRIRAILEMDFTAEAQRAQRRTHDHGESRATQQHHHALSASSAPLR